MCSKKVEWTALVKAKEVELAEVRKAIEYALDAACEGLMMAEETVSTTRALLDGERTALGRAVGGFQRQVNTKNVDRVTLLKAKAAQSRASACALGAAREECIAVEKELGMTLSLLSEERTASRTTISDLHRQLEIREADLRRVMGQAEESRALSNHKDEMIGDCMALVTDQGNNSLALMRVLNVRLGKSVFFMACFLLGVNGVHAYCCSIQVVVFVIVLVSFVLRVCID